MSCLFCLISINNLFTNDRYHNFDNDELEDDQYIDKENVSKGVEMVQIKNKKPDDIVMNLRRYFCCICDY